MGRAGATVTAIRREGKLYSRLTLGSMESRFFT